MAVEPARRRACAVPRASTPRAASPACVYGGLSSGTGRRPCPSRRTAAPSTTVSSSYHRIGGTGTSVCSPSASMHLVLDLEVRLEEEVWRVGSTRAHEALARGSPPSVQWASNSSVSLENPVNAGPLELGDLEIRPRRAASSPASRGVARGRPRDRAVRGSACHRPTTPRRSPQPRHFVGAEAPAGEDGGGVVARMHRRRGNGRRGAAEARRGRGLRHAVELEERAARPRLCGWSGASSGVEHRREARVGALEQLAPLVAGLRAEHRGELLLRGGQRAWSYWSRQRSTSRPSRSQQLGVELRLDRPDRDELPVGATRRPRRRARRCRAWFVPRSSPEAAGACRVERREHQRRAVDHGRVDHLALAAARPLEQRARDAEARAASRRRRSRRAR